MKALAEARTSRRATRAPSPKAPASATGSRGNGLHEASESDDEDEAVQLRRAGEPAAETQAPVPPLVRAALRDRGQALEAGLRRDFESRMGHDFSQVRVHTGAQAAASAHALRAAAYTVGRDLVFGAGRFAPQSSEGRWLLAHELAHAAQNGRGAATATTQPLTLGETDSLEEREADQAAEAALRGRPAQPLRRAAPALRRAPGTGPGWTGARGINAKESSVGSIRRVPIDKLSVGQQTASTPSGRAIVLIPSGFDPTQSADILLHFHGHNAGYTEIGGTVRDQQQDRIEAQMQAAGRTQLLGLLPQGDANSSFGQQGGRKVFSTDDFIDAVLGTLVSIGAIKSRPKVGQVTIAGHSGAGELINEKLLGGAAGSSLPGKFGTLRQVALFDAVNGPKEFEALQGFLKKALASDLAALTATPKVDDQLAFLKTSFRFRSYYSHSPDTGEFYRKWHKGPVPAGKVKDPTPLGKQLDDFFAALTLDPKVVKAFHDNYRVVDAGDKVEHDKMVGHGDHLQDALALMPKHEPRAGPLPRFAPPEVREVLCSPGRQLPECERDWAEARFRRSFEAVRVHDDMPAARSAQSLHAQAYTVGRDIVFAPGHFAPGTATGRRLLAHELSHVVQQGARAASLGGPDPLPVGRPHDRFEREADQAEHSAGEVRSEGIGLRVQRAPDPKSVDAAMCEANANPNPAQLGDCNYKQPEHCPTYEMWVATFTLLKTFGATDTPFGKTEGFQAIGGGPADADFRPSSQPSKPAPPPTTALKPGERFIDHPTDVWVKTCLPENLRATAYQLPADCADVAMILRHVWLAAHKRTETFGKWTLGSAAGRAEEKSVLNMIVNEGTGTVAGMVAPYSDPATGKPLRSFAKLAPLLHPGDILVWWHFDKGFDKPRTGGHTHTIAAVQHEPSGEVTSLTLLQGNEPLFQPQKEAIRAQLKKEDPKAALPTDDVLGHAPGRRVERTTSEDPRSPMDLTDLADTEVTQGKEKVRVWKWGAETLLVAAGPPRAAGQRPPTQPIKGEKGIAPQRLTDWMPALARAPAPRFMGVLEGMLYELRATVEGGREVPENDVRAVGSAAGGNIWSQGKAAGDLGNTSHFQRLQDVLDVTWAFATSREIATSRKLDSAYDKITGELLKHLRWLREAFELAARGATDIDFARRTPKGPAVNVLLTGFDPFEPTGSLRRPDAGQWNPSGAAVLALDNQRLPVADSQGHKGTAAVEGIVLPVSFDRFNEGIVEQAVGPHVKELDALLTVSMDGRRAPGDPVRLERYAVGVHEIGGAMQGVPAAPGGALGPAAIESNAPLDQIADATAQPAGKGKSAIARPEIGESFVFDFGSVKQARAAHAMLGGDLGGTAGTDVSSQPPSRLLVKDSATVHDIVASMVRVGSGAQVKFRVRQKDFKATLVEGPGGNFLSNEVSYRAQRLLKGAAPPRDPWSFHAHTPSTSAIPQDTGSKEALARRKEATSRAMGQRSSLIDTLKRLIGSVARLILDRRAKQP